MNNVSTPEALEMLSEIAGLAEINPDIEFGTLGLDSLMLIEWISLLEEKLDVDFNIRDLDLSELSALSTSAVVDGLRKRAGNA